MLGQKYRRKISDLWLSLTISKKIRIFVELFFIIISLSILFNVLVVKYSLSDFRSILKQEAASSLVIDSIEYENNCFKDYIKSPTKKNQSALNDAVENTAQAIASLPFDYSKMSEDRYIKTWAIKNSYDYYTEKRDGVLAMGEENPDYISEVYKIYDIQSAILDYCKTLMGYALEEGTAEYKEKVGKIERIPLVIAVFGMAVFIVILTILHLLKKNITEPILQLAEASRRIASNDYEFEDVEVMNRDEVGELVDAFNKMKYSTASYITSLKEKREMMDRLHKEEVQRLKMENQLEAINLKLIKSQLDPHFLFNTLNVISGMAVIEEAETTEKMINVMSSLFRYNLKNQELEVPLSQELKAANDYMYLQKMRFGDRVEYIIENKVDDKRTIVPTYLLQPLIENAIKHGISRKEQGGRVVVRIWGKANKLIVTIADNGMGMSKERLEEVTGELMAGRSDTIGIGLSNIYKRVNDMYREGKFEVYSRLNVGTAIRIVIPQNRGE